MPTTDEDLQKSRDAVQKLRDQIAAAEADRDRRTRELDNDVAAAQLEAERLQLEAQLVQLKHDAKPATVKAGAGAPLQSAREQMELAVEQAKQAEALRNADAKGSSSKDKSTTTPEAEAVVADKAATQGADARKEN